MRVESVRLKNFRAFVDSGDIHLSRVNVFVGHNNAGKSSILRALHLIQHSRAAPFGDVRVGASSAEVEIKLGDLVTGNRWGIPQTAQHPTLTVSITTPDRRGGSTAYQLYYDGSGRTTGDLRIPASEPSHFVVPFLSRRRAPVYSEDIREQYVHAVAEDNGYLAAKLSRLANPVYPTHQSYADACAAILGFVVTTVPSPSGQLPGRYLKSGEALPIDQLGDGVPQIVHMLTSLADSTDKLFLIEEPENDIHPSALKALLTLIQKSSEVNQFVVSTHSNIVVSQLCSAAGSRLFRVAAGSESDQPGAIVTDVQNVPDARISVLHDLGYAFSDFALWDGWILLEESSAETLIVGYLIPMFAPRLLKLRTLAAGGADKIEPTFDDLHRLVLFTHLTPAYAGRAWVRLDGDEKGKNIIQKLRTKYPSISTDHFDVFPAAQFELYYPLQFRERADTVMATPSGQAKREAKRALLMDVVTWLDEDSERARTALEQSAAEVIADLRLIQSAFDALTA
jgi:AAA domain, putative AbiEii toxin, Type IV TA system/AAA ATPase domain